jgi:hypothetical protein
MFERESGGRAGGWRWLAALWLSLFAGLAPVPLKAQALPADTELAYFELVGIEGTVATLEWETISEAGAVGFKVYRSTESDGYRTPIAIVPAVGDPSSSTTYAITDTLESGVTHWYWLADVNTQGVEQALTTPISVSTGLQAVVLPLPHRLYLSFIKR